LKEYCAHSNIAHSMEMIRTGMIAFKCRSVRIRWLSTRFIPEESELAEPACWALSIAMTLSPESRSETLDPVMGVTKP